MMRDTVSDHRLPQLHNFDTKQTRPKLQRSEIEIESLPTHSGRLILRACPDGGETIKSSPFVSLSSFENKIVFLSNGEEEKLTLPEATGDVFV